MYLKPHSQDEGELGSESWQTGRVSALQHLSVLASSVELMDLIMGESEVCFKTCTAPASHALTWPQMGSLGNRPGTSAHMLSSQGHTSDASKAEHQSAHAPLPAPLHRAYVFRAQSAEMKERGGNQTSGIDFFITQERIVFLDTQVPAPPAFAPPCHILH